MAFYEFSQNNSGGSFVVDERVCHRVFIEAETPDEANAKAVSIGIYFDGCAEGRDCPCCGDRWYSVDDYDKVDFPEEYGCEVFKNVEEYAKMLKAKYGWTEPDARIFYKNGVVSEV